MAAARDWCFTINNPDFAINEVDMPASVKYVSWQLEIGEEGTLHYQGFIQFFGPQRLSALKKLFPTAHFEKRRGTAEQARDYSMKEESRIEGPWEIGEFAGGQGKRTDLADAAELVKKKGARAVAHEMPEVYLKFHRGLHALEQALEKPRPDPDFVPRPWQARVLALLSQPPNDRNIIWVKDTVGNHGKSRLALHLQREHGAVQLKGRVADMAYMYNKERIVVIDVPRTYADNMDHLYAFAEELKNGVVISTKYESCRKMFDPPHVVFFANFCPASDKWSADRVVQFDLQNPDVHVSYN